MSEINYQEFFVTFPEWQPEKKDGFAKIIAENLDEAALVVAAKIGTDFARVYTADEFPNYGDRRSIYPKGETQTFAVVNHNEKRILLNDAPLDERAVEWESQEVSKELVASAGHGKDSVFDIYVLTGAHDGEPIRLAVKNVQKDFDTSGMTIDHDGYFWADDLTSFDDLIPDWYDGILFETIERDFLESYEPPMSGFVF